MRHVDPGYPYLDSATILGLSTAQPLAIALGFVALLVLFFMKLILVGLGLLPATWCHPKQGHHLGPW